jgi:hypothetical protein
MKHLIATLAMALSTAAQAGLINGGFESPLVPGNPSYALFNPALVPGWKTTDSAIEIWDSGFNGVTSYEGVQHAEINAYVNGTLYQDVSGIGAGYQVGFQFAHRARVGTDVMRLTITDLGLDNLFGGGNDTELFTKTYSATTAAWVFNASLSESAIFGLGHTVRFAYAAVSTGSGSQSVGNFLDAADFGVDVNTPGCGQPGGQPCPTPEPNTLALLGFALAGLRLRRARNHQSLRG